MKDQRQRLAEQPIPRLLFDLSVPATVGMATMAFYILADTIFVGRGVGALGIAGMTVVFPLMTLLLGLGQLLGIGGGSLISRALGSGRMEDAERCLGNLLVLVALAYLLICLPVVWFSDPLLRAFGADGQVLVLAEQYMKIVVGGGFFHIFNVTSNNVIRSQGHAKVAMLSMVLGALINLALDPILIFGFGMGMRGAAVATVLGNLGMTLYVLRYFLGGGSLVAIRASCLGLRRAVVREIMAVGFSSFVRQSSGSLMVLLANRLLVFHGGDQALAMFGILHRLLMFCLMPIFGIIHGMMPIVGFNYGAGDYRRARETIGLAVKSTTILTGGTFLLFMTMPRLLTLMFTDEPELLAMSSMVLRIGVLGAPTIGFQFVTAGMYQALGRARPALILSLARQVLFLIPMLLLLPRWFGVFGVWFSLPLADFAASGLTYFMFRAEIGRLHHRHGPSIAQFDSGAAGRQ